MEINTSLEHKINEAYAINELFENLSNDRNSLKKHREILQTLDSIKEEYGIKVYAHYYVKYQKVF